MLGTKEKRKEGKKGEKKETKICDVKSEHFVPSPITTLSLQRPTLSSYTKKHTNTLQVICFARCPTYLPTTYKPPTRTLFYQHPEPSGEPNFTIPIPPSVLSYFFFSPQEFRLLQGEKRRERKEEKKIKKNQSQQNASSFYHKHYKHHSTNPRSQTPSPHCRNMRLDADQPIRTITTPLHGSRRMHTRPNILIVGYHD